LSFRAVAGWRDTSAGGLELARGMDFVIEARRKRPVTVDRLTSTAS
jgi:hypothetical protein